jgi:large subunit ribosomal protein L32
MASLALPSSSRLLSTTARLRLPVARALLSATLALPPFAAVPRPFAWAAPALESLLELFPPFLLAVPKKKVSHSRKSMRSANKGLKDKQSAQQFYFFCNVSYSTCHADLVHCPGCGAPKLAHHLCGGCFSEVNRRLKRETRAPEPGA